MGLSPRPALRLVLLLVELLVVGRLAHAPQVSAWSLCPAQATPSRAIECATAVVPLCYTDVCGTSDSSETITLFLKRIPANTMTETARPKNAWMIPERSDVVLPSEANDQMERLYRQLGGEVSVYTLDQRGTGQSTRLTCNQSSSVTTNSSAQLRLCLQSLSEQYSGHFAAFSITSAAYDLVTLISQTQTNSDVVVYGLGHGMLVVERLLYFGVKEIKGYVLDASVTTTGSSADQFAYLSQSDAAFGEVGDEFLRLCDSDHQCSTKFQGDRSVSEALSDVIKRIDVSQCSSLWRNGSSGNNTWATVYPSSFNVRHTLAMLMQNVTERGLIPVVVYRLGRCNAEDQAVLNHLVVRLQERERELERNRELVYDLQDFSELWELGALLPTQSTMRTRFMNALISPGRVFDQLPTYCIFVGDSSSEACVASTDNSSETVAPTRFTYARDKFWSTAVTIPAHASVLLLSSSLDGLAPLKHSTVLAQALQGSAKALLTFESGAHGVLTTSIQEPSDEKASCGYEILSSYILNSGSLGAYNTSCMEQLKLVSFNMTEAMSLALLNVTYPYDDGSMDSSQASDPPLVEPDHYHDSEKDTSSLTRTLNLYRAAFIIVTCLLSLLLLAALVLLCRRRDSKQLQDEERELRRMRGDASDDLELLRQICMSSPEAWGHEDALFGRSQTEQQSSDAEENHQTYYYRSSIKEVEETKESSRAWVYRSKHIHL